MNPEPRAADRAATVDRMPFDVHSSTEAIMNHDDAEGTNLRRVRLLIPIDATAESRWGVAYALRLHDEGCMVEACFLNVGEPITQWEVLRFRTQAEIATFQSERAQAFIEEACAPLIAKGIACRGFFKQGNLVFSILDTAEELECNQIVMSRSTSGFWRIFGRNVANLVIRRQKGIPVVLVGQDGAVASHPVH